MYAEAAGYEQSVTNMERITLATDMVFGDDLAAREMATIVGDPRFGYVSLLMVTVDPTAVEEPGGGMPPGGPGGPGGPSGPPPSGPPPSASPSASSS